MEARELMIGDWVMRGNFAHEPMQVYSIRPDINTVHMDFGGMGVAARIDQINPIPLTPEILEKNGFVKFDTNSAEDYLYVPDLSPCFAYGYFPNGVKKGWIIQISNDYLIVSYRRCSLHMEIHFVHELQHAIRLCEIEKEIVL